MGTNFYWLATGKHIGKRSAAGWYCWDCEVTLLDAGIDAIHKGYGEFYDKCPVCETPRTKPRSIPQSAALELGFTERNDRRPVGVNSASSFSWGQAPDRAIISCLEAGDRLVIEDEYGYRMTGREFLDMLENQCPIRFYQNIGKEFS